MATFTLAFVNSFTDHRNGHVRHQFRRKGFKKVLLRGQPGSSEFMEHYQELLARSEDAAAHVGASRFKRGTIDELILRYQQSGAFAELAKPTRDTRRRILDKFRDFKTPSGRRYGDNALKTMERKDVVAAIRGKTPIAARGWLKALRPFLSFAIAEGEIRGDPTLGIKARIAATAGHLTWTDEAIEQYRARHPIGSMARVALELALNVAARRNDLHLLGRQHLSRDGYLSWRPSKTSKSTGRLLKIKVLPSLQRALDAMPVRDTLTLLQTAFGQPFASAAAFGNKFATWCEQAGLVSTLCDDGKTRSFRLHGLRKAALKALAHCGATGPELMSISGHASLAEVQIYIREAEQTLLAESAMMKLAAGTKRARARTSEAESHD
jgi:integrase